MKTIPPQTKSWIKKSKTFNQLTLRLLVAFSLPLYILFFTALGLFLVTNGNSMLYILPTLISGLAISLYNRKALDEVVIWDWKRGVQGLKKGFE